MAKIQDGKIRENDVRDTPSLPDLLSAIRNDEEIGGITADDLQSVKILQSLH